VAAGCSSEDSAGGAGGAGNCEDPALSCFDACMCRSNDAANCKLGCPSGTGGTGTGGTGGTPPTGPVGKCSDAPPPGAPKPAAPKAFTGGTCPALVPGMNNIQSTTARQ